MSKQEIERLTDQLLEQDLPHPDKGDWGRRHDLPPKRFYQSRADRDQEWADDWRPLAVTTIKDAYEELGQQMGLYLSDQKLAAMPNEFQRYVYNKAWEIVTTEHDGMAVFAGEVYNQTTIRGEVLAILNGMTYHDMRIMARALLDEYLEEQEA